MLPVVAVIGIIVASLGLLGAAYGLVSSVAMMFMPRAMPFQLMTRGAMIVTMGDAVIGAGLSGLLMTGSIGLMRLHPWSRRVLHWWIGLYLLRTAATLALTVLVLVPSQIAMMRSIMSQSAPTTSPAGGTNVTTTTVTTTNSGVTTTTVGPAGPGAAQFAQMVPMFRRLYIGMALGWAVVRIIFPTFLLIVLQLKKSRTALSPYSNQSGPEHLTV
jgi:hypothetical protein